MALSSSIVWEVRTTGNANNGGGFKTGASGTDFSQQDAAQYSLSSLTSSGAGAVILTASAAADMVGNIINITAGTNFTTGYYEITSVSAGTSITVDRNCTTGAGASGVAYIGGATDHPQNLVSARVAGNKIFIKSGTYVKIGSNAYVLYDNGAQGTSSSPVVYEGFKTSHGDAPTGTDRPLLDATSNTTYSLQVNTNGLCFSHLRFANATSNGTHGDAGNNGYATRFYNCKSSSNGGAGFATRLNVLYYNCEANNNTAGGFGAGSSSYGHDCFFCYSHDNTGTGYLTSGGGGAALNTYNCIADTNSSHGFQNEVGNAINCVAYNNTGASVDGFNGVYRLAYNNISSSNGRYGFNGTCLAPFFNYNLYNGNGTAGLNGITAGANDVTSAPSFTDAANGNFSLQSSSPAKNAGFPGSSMAGATV